MFAVAKRSIHVDWLVIERMLWLVQPDELGCLLVLTSGYVGWELCWAMEVPDPTHLMA